MNDFDHFPIDSLFILNLSYMCEIFCRFVSRLCYYIDRSFSLRCFQLFVHLHLVDIPITSFLFSVSPSHIILPPSNSFLSPNTFSVNSLYIGAIFQLSCSKTITIKCFHHHLFTISQNNYLISISIESYHITYSKVICMMISTSGPKSFV